MGFLAGNRVDTKMRRRRWRVGQVLTKLKPHAWDEINNIPKKEIYLLCIRLIHATIEFVEHLTEEHNKH